MSTKVSSLPRPDSAGSEGELGGAAVFIDASEVDDQNDDNFEDQILSALLGEPSKAAPVVTAGQVTEIHKSEFVQAWDRDMRAFLAR